MEKISHKIIAVTLNWNGSDDTEELLESLKNVNWGSLRVIIVDNNSNRDEATKLSALVDDNIQLIKLNENLGFAGGNNVGIIEALNQNADYVLIINNDTVVDKNFLIPLIEKFQLDSKVGIVAPHINYFSEPNKIWSAGGKISRIRGSGFAISNKLESDIPQNDSEVQFVSGCCMLIKNDVFQKIGLFDENFFLYLEDTDFCYRVIKAGYKIIVTPRSKIFHKVSMSTKSNYSTLPLYYTTRNRLFFSKKNFKRTYFLTALYIFISMLIKSILWFLTGRKKNITVVKIAFRDFFAGKTGRINLKIFNAS